jgi:RNA polymerase sigma-70 factor, ECF subfamily
VALNQHGAWTLTPKALDGFLRRLAGDPETAAQEYTRLRQKVDGFFQRRGIDEPETLTDETLDRVARRLDEGESVERLKAYVYGVARLVAMEWYRQRALRRTAETQPPGAPRSAPSKEFEERRSACLERCLNALPPESRALIQRYHACRLEERRRLADVLGLSYTTLKTRAHRIRRELLSCLEACSEDATRRNE